MRFPEVLLIGPEGQQFGKVTRNEALRKAEEYGLDLLCVSPNSALPVCKLVNYGKHRYEAKKKAKEVKKNQKIIEIKEIRLTPQIGDHDINTKSRHCLGFLSEGNKVKVSVRFKGRQLAHIDVGEETLKKFLDSVKEFAIIEKEPVLDGKWLTCILASKVKK